MTIPSRPHLSGAVAQRDRHCGGAAQRERKLNMAVIMLPVIAMGIYTRLSVGEVMAKMVRGLRLLTLVL